MICDTQVHIWGPDTPSRPWPTVHGTPHRELPLNADEVIRAMDEVGVDRAVIVPPSWEGDRNDLAMTAVLTYPGRFAIMGRINLQGPKDGLDHWRETPGMLGARLTFHRPEMRTWLTDGTAEWVWQAAERLNLPVMLLAPGQNDAIVAVAKDFPGLNLIVDHLNLASDATSNDIGPAVEALMALTDCPNVTVKISALPCYTEERFPFLKLGTYIRRVVDAFGSERCMWGSDLSRLPCPYSEWVSILRPSTPILNEHEADLIGGGTAARVLQWPW